MPSSPTLTSSELGTLWMTYQEKTTIICILEYLNKNADDEEARTIMIELIQFLNEYVDKIKTIFQTAGAVVPIGFTSQDVNIHAPKLFENGFDIMFVRVLKELSMGLYTLNLGKSYRVDIIDLYKDLTAITQDCYNKCTQYLLVKGLLPRPPYTVMPKSTDYLNDVSYFNGFTLFGEKRPINTIELSQLYHGMESNNIGMRIMQAFSQVAKSSDVVQYFTKGVELSKHILTEFGDILLKNNISPSVSPGGNTTTSKDSPFSDKLMMYCTKLLSNFSLGSNAFGAAFSLRKDLTLKSLLIAKDVLDYTHAGDVIMAQNGWMEEPPQIQ